MLEPTGSDTWTALTLCANTAVASTAMSTMKR